MMNCRNSNALILSALLLALWHANGFCQRPQTSQPLTENENPLLIGKRDINKNQFNFYSAEREMALGRQLAVEIEQQSKLVDDAGVNDYLAKLGRNLALHSDATIPVTIKVVDSEEVNAVALPGGFLYVNLGLMRVVETESELAAVIAHLIAHVAARHGVEFATKAEKASQPGFRQVVFDERLDGGLNPSASLGFLAFRRKAEAEADALGAQYLWATGYDPHAMATFFAKLQVQEERKPGTMRIFSAHPPPLERISKVEELIARFPQREKLITTTEEFDRVKARLPLEPPKNQIRRK